MHRYNWRIYDAHGTIKIHWIHFFSLFCSCINNTGHKSTVNGVRSLSNTVSQFPAYRACFTNQRLGSRNNSCGTNFKGRLHLHPHDGQMDRHCTGFHFSMEQTLPFFCCPWNLGCVNLNPDNLSWLLWLFAKMVPFCGWFFFSCM